MSKARFPARGLFHYHGHHISKSSLSHRQPTGNEPREATGKGLNAGVIPAPMSERH